MLSNKNISGTSFHGQTIKATYNELVEALGGPPQYTNGDKSNYDWTCETNDGTVFTVYDWKEYRKFGDDETIEWHIGSYSEEEGNDAFFYVLDKLNA
jgi:hypothetical protein